jgi:carbon storage regulator
MFFSGGFRMLVLSREAGQKIIIGHGYITVQVVDIRNGRVRLGIEAPKELAVHREEVELIIQREQAKAIKSDIFQPPQDDQPLLDKMENEHGR